ncbi:MAG: hypothetical protein ABSF25_18585 [Bryobacteraceae bacterium]|jgi:hypothetical protein
MTRKLAIGLFALLALSAGIASADEFTFSYSSVLDSSVTASGIITANNDGGGVYTITGITGTRNGDPITFVQSPDPGAFAVDNNLIVPPNPAYLSSTGSSGFVISTVDGDFNPWYDYNGSFGGTTGLYYEYDGGSVPGTEITFTATDVPETSSILFLLTMVGGVFGAMKLRRA